MTLSNFPEKGYLHEEFRLFHNTDTLGTPTDAHVHDFYKLTFVKYGSGSYMIDGRLYDVRTGDIILVGRGIPHKPSFPAGDLYDRYTLYISAGMLESFDLPDCPIHELFYSESANVIRPETRQTDRFIALFDRIRVETKSSSYAAKLAARLGVIRLLIEAGRCREESALTVPLRKGEEEDKLLLLRFVNENLHTPITEADIASHFQMSPETLTADFSAAFGCPLSEYMRNRRLNKAHGLILEGMAPAEVCYACGYGSYQSFSDDYQEKYGDIPRKPIRSSSERDFPDYFPE